MNVNTPEEYEAAQRCAGPEVTARVLASTASTVRAATARAAAGAVGLELSPGISAMLGDGYRAATDAEPVPSGDTVTFIASGVRRPGTGFSPR